jgi:survival-of-motor-neuron-related-splicing factor 30
LLVLTCLQLGFFDRVYEAEIEEIDGENGTAAITFSGYGNAEVVPLQNLKPAEEGKHSEDDGKSKSRYERQRIC